MKKIKNINIKKLRENLILYTGIMSMGCAAISCDFDKEVVVVPPETKPSIASEVIETENEVNMVLKDNLNVRDYKSTDGSILDILKKGTIVTVYKDSTYNDGEYEWIYVNYVDSDTKEIKCGWMALAQYIDSEVEYFLEEQEVVNDTLIDNNTVLKDNVKIVNTLVPLKLRSGYTTSSQVISQLNLGTQVSVDENVAAEFDGRYNWVYVSYVDSDTKEIKCGWVAAVDKQTGDKNLVSKEEFISDIDSKLISEYAILYDITNGEVLYEKVGSKVNSSPASITKVISAYLVMKYGDLEDYITYSNSAVRVEGHDVEGYGTTAKSPVYDIVHIGNSISVKDALHISLLLSDNATTVALQEYIEKKTGKDFIKLMNEEAQNIGCEYANFTNSYGYEDEKHLLSAQDMAKLVSHIYKNEPSVIDIMGTYKYDFIFDNKDISINHQSVMIDPKSQYYSSDVLGSKTGFHDLARQTMVTVYEKNGNTYVIVTLYGKGVQSKNQDTKLLYNIIDTLSIKNDINSDLESNMEDTTNEQEMETLETYNLDEVDSDEIKFRLLPHRVFDYKTSCLYDDDPTLSKPIMVFSKVYDEETVNVDETKYYKGIDVSSYQGKIDWNAVNSTDVDFVILRVGASLYNDDNTFSRTSIDENFEYNIKECNRLGIPVGVYYYSMAKTEEQNQQEIDTILNIIKKYDISLPVYRDIEFTVLEDFEVGGDRKENQLNLTNDFINAMENAGYDSGIYINKNYLHMVEQLDCSKWVTSGYYYSTITSSGIHFEDMPFMYEDELNIYDGGNDVDIYQVTEKGKASSVGVTDCEYIDYNYASKEAINEFIEDHPKVKILR